MAEVQIDSDISFDDLILLIKKNKKGLEDFAGLVPTRSAETDFQRLKTVVAKLGTQASSRPPYSERYIQQWTDFEAGKSGNIEQGAARYLCWESEIATTEKFLTYLQQFEIELNRRSLEGLVRSCHNKWEGSFPESPQVAKVRRFLDKYDGPSPVLIRWKSHLTAILGKDGPRLLAKELIEKDRTLKDHLDQWYLEAKSPFVRQLVATATTLGRQRLDAPTDRLLEILFNELLPWTNWRISDLKKEIAEIILHRACTGKNQDLVQAFVLEHRELLGDPRLPANRRKWAEMPDGAKNKVLQWLCRQDIYFFFDHVYQDRKDPHHRKEFWLRYLEHCVASRPLLGSNDAVRLRTILQRDRSKVGHFGNLRGGDNSAFLLDFGSITVVEFSKVGACFIYENRSFANIVDFWQSSFSETELKDPLRCLKRIVHHITANIDWRIEAQRTLAMKNVRPG